MHPFHQTECMSEESLCGNGSCMLIEDFLLPLFHVLEMIRVGPANNDYEKYAKESCGKGI